MTTHRHGLRASRTVLTAGALLLAALAPAGAMEFEPPEVLCDRLAGNLHDADFVGAGVHYGEVDLARAEPACLTAVESHPEERRYRYQLGRVYAEMGDWFNAYANYQVAAAQGSAIALVGIGLLYEYGDGFEQDTARAADYYRQAADLDLPLAYANLGWLTEAGDGVPQDYAEALRLYQRAADLGDAWSLVSIGYLYLEGDGVAEDRAEAERLFREALPDDDIHTAAYAGNALAWLLAEDGRDLDEAESLALAAVDAEQTDIVMRANYLDTLALVLHTAGRNDEAIGYAEEAVFLDPEQPGTQNRLGNIYAALGRGVEAKAAWRLALELPPPDPMIEPDWDANAIRQKIDATP